MSGLIDSSRKAKGGWQDSLDCGNTLFKETVFRLLLQSNSIIAYLTSDEELSTGDVAQTIRVYKTLV